MVRRRGQTAAQRAASIANLKKARAARTSKAKLTTSNTEPQRNDDVLHTNSHAALDIAAKEAEAGGTVLWFANRKSASVDAQRRLANHICPNLIHKNYRGYGNEHITTTTGGKIVLCSRWSASRGYTADMLIFDNTPIYPDALPCIAGNPNGRVYATLAPGTLMNKADLFWKAYQKSKKRKKR